MTNHELLKAIVEDSGISITHIAQELNCSRNRVYAILGGSECTASEIVKLSEVLHLTQETRDSIFLMQNVSESKQVNA